MIRCKQTCRFEELSKRREPLMHALEVDIP